MWFRTDEGEIINLDAFAGIHLQMFEGTDNAYCVVAEPIIRTQEPVVLTEPMSEEHALMVIDHIANRVKAMYVQDVK